MDAEIKRKWTAALRSAEYKQARGKLHDPKEDAYCCLGVLCRVQGATFEEATGSNDDGEPYFFGRVPILNNEIISARGDEELSEKFLQELGLTLEDMSELVERNDGNHLTNTGHPNYQREHSFAEIADYIEANL